MTERATDGGGVVHEIRELYRASLKKEDIAWNLYVARPVAAVALFFLKRTSITPNQLSFLGLFLFFGVPALMIAVPSAWGFLAAAAALELSYVADCADGQLARLKSMTSNVGAYLDFLIDEVKALLLVGGAAVGAWQSTHDLVWLLVGVGGIAMVSIATTLTTFVRRPEYAGEEVRPGENVRGPAMPTGLLPRVIWFVMRSLRFIVHYPSWILIYAIVPLLIPDLNAFIGFLALYLGVYLLYVGRVGLSVFLRLASPKFYDK